jgi:hypothetical protein
LKTGIIPYLNQMFSILAVTFCFVPLFLYWWKKLGPERSYLIVALFWTINGSTYTPEIFHWTWYNSITNQITLYYNLIDAPLIILFFYFFYKKKFFLYLLVGFIFFEVLMIAWKGFNFDSNDIIIGVGSLICLILNIWGISLYLRNIEHSSFENVMVFINAGFIFYYGLFPVTFYFNYLQSSRVVLQANLPYVTFINYFSICMATGLISYGLWKFAIKKYREEHF